MVKQPANKKCLISFFNTSSGRFKWWDEFPIEVRKYLSELKVDCYYFYKSRTDRSLYDKDEIYINPERSGDGALNDEKWLQENVWPIMERYDDVIIHTHSYYPPTKLRKLISKHMRATWVATIHRCPNKKAPLLVKFYKRVLRHFGYLPEWYIGVSCATTEYIRNYFGRSKVLTIKNGVNISDYKHRIKRESSAKQENFRYLFVNRLDKGKGIKELLSTVTDILQINSEFQLTIAGDGPYRKLVEEFLERSKSPNINYVGYSDNVDTLYATHDVLLMPFTQPQGLSLISLEARAFGLPAIYTKMDGDAESRNETNGIVMLAATSEALIKAISKIETSSNFVDLINGCYNGLEYFSIQRMAKEYQDF